MTADTGTIDSHSDSRTCVIRAPLKPFDRLAFRRNIIRSAESSSKQLHVFYSLMLKAKAIKIQPAPVKKNHHSELSLSLGGSFGTTVGSQSAGETSWLCSVWALIQRHNVRAAVRKSSRLHQRVLRRWCVEAGQRESRCQVALFCHPPGKMSTQHCMHGIIIFHFNIYWSN